MGNPGWRSGLGLEVFEVGTVELAGIGRQERRRPITCPVCFAAVPYTVQGHDCRGIFAATVARVHTICGRMTRAAVVAMIACRMRGCSCARTQTVGSRRSSAAIAIGATSTVLTAPPMRVACRCMQRGGVTRQIPAARPNMQIDRAATGPVNIGRAKIKCRIMVPPRIELMVCSLRIRRWSKSPRTAGRRHAGMNGAARVVAVAVRTM